MLYSYLKCTDRLLDVLFLLLAVILSELHENSRWKDWVTEKSTWKNLCEGRHLFGYMPSFLCHFCRFFRVLRFKVEKNTFALKNGGAPPIPSLPPLPALPVSTAVLHKVNLHW